MSLARFEQVVRVRDDDTLIVSPEPYSLDLGPFLPPGWDRTLERLADSAPAVRKEAGPGSLNVDGGGLDYHSHSRDALVEGAPWLKHLYEVTLPTLLRLHLQREPLCIDAPHAIMLNVLRHDSSLGGLEWHVDGQDHERVVVLSLDEWDQTSGGRFIAHDGQAQHFYDLGKGIGLSAPGADLPHAVEPIHVKDAAAPKRRITVMFAYTSRDRAGLRDPAQNEYQFTEAPTPVASIEDGPHSRACGLGEHPHGDACADDCPTCGHLRGEI